jgi:hypothetical protein
MDKKGAPKMETNAFQFEVNIGPNSYESWAEIEGVIQKAVDLVDEYEKGHSGNRTLLVVKLNV